jgi:hypothetical protein
VQILDKSLTSLIQARSVTLLVSEAGLADRVPTARDVIDARTYVG